eukprot:COSAG06_NODE_681_length_13133_cov_6.625547_8_plen_74_part_00
MLQSSWVWSELRGLARRCLFSKRAVRQYTGFVQDRLRKAAKALVRHVLLSTHSVLPMPCHDDVAAASRFVLSV